MVSLKKYLHWIVHLTCFVHDGRHRAFSFVLVGLLSAGVPQDRGQNSWDPMLKKTQK